jgi:hypothetical protein
MVEKVGASYGSCQAILTEDLGMRCLNQVHSMAPCTGAERKLWLLTCLNMQKLMKTY